LTLLCAAGTTGCGSAKKAASNTTTAARSSTAGSSTTTSANSIRYRLAITTSAAGSARLSVHGTTNLPDGAIIKLSAAQAFRSRREPAVREAPVVAGQERVTVKHGAFSASLGPLSYGLLTAGLKRGGEPGFGPIVVLDSAVTVCATFQTGVERNGKPVQPDASVRAAVGTNGENLKGSPQKVVFGARRLHSSNWLEAPSRASVGATNAAAAVARAQGVAPRLEPLHGFCLA
jgi:hypothetical protein